MTDIQDQLAAAEKALETATTAVEQAIADLNTTEPTTADNVLSALTTAVQTAGLVEVFGADKLSEALEEANYTVTPPVADAPLEEQA